MKQEIAPLSEKVYLHLDRRRSCRHRSPTQQLFMEWEYAR